MHFTTCYVHEAYWIPEPPFIRSGIDLKDYFLSFEMIPNMTYFRVRLGEFQEYRHLRCKSSKSGIYNFLSQFGYAESKNGGYQK